MSFWREIPPVEAIKMEPEELAPFVLRYLQGQPPDSINRYNFTLPQHELYEIFNSDNRAVKTYLEYLIEAWMYLERQGFIAPKPGQQGEWMFVTRRGRAVADATDFEAYKQAYLLNADTLDPVLLQKVRADYAKGDYGDAIFKAYKEVEVRVRKQAGLSPSDIGVNLMRKAFNPEGGMLTDKTAERSEQVARMELFAGSIGAYKNPSSHREVDISDPREVADIIHVANQLLRILDRIEHP
jgi:uncharacterized protein (TIGR02391 family)